MRRKTGDIKDAAEARKSFIEEWYGDAIVELEERERETQYLTGNDDMMQGSKIEETQN